MIDQHFVELQLLHSAAVVDRTKMNGNSAAVVDRTKMFGTSAAVVERTKMNSNSEAVVDRTKMEGNSAAALDKKQVNGKKKYGRRGLSDVDLLSERKIRRRPSDIDSLSPEVLKALQSTFGGKLDEIRSKIQVPPRPSPPPSPPSPPPPPSSALSPIKTAPAIAKERTFIERLADREGLYMLIAYFSAVFLSGFILLATDGDDDDSNINGHEESCKGRVDGNCARLFGHILPIGLSASFFIFAWIFFVFDVSFSFFNILTATEDFLYETKNSWASTKTSGEDDVRVRSGRPSPELMLLLATDVGFIIVPSVLLWVSKTSTVDPLYTLCEQRLQLLWMLGLMIMVVVILLAGIKSFWDPLVSKAYIQTAARTASIIVCVLLLCTALYYSIAEPREVSPCVPARPEGTSNHTSMAKEHQIQLYNRQCGECSEPLLRYGWSKITGVQLYEDTNWRPDRDYQQCSWPRHRRTNLLRDCDCRQEPEMMHCEWPRSRRRCLHGKEEIQNLEWCEANYSQLCEWPRMKQVQPYEGKDRCSIGFPQCDWPRAKQIQAFEHKDRCQAQILVQCEWPWVKQIQLYEHKERCRAKVEILQQCDWPWLKQIQLYVAHDRCPLKNPQECEWPWVKQIQLYETKDSSQDSCMR